MDAGTLPVTVHLDALARSGFYGALAPRQHGGLGLGYQDLCMAVEELSSYCLASTFVWVQHFRLLGAALDPLVPEPVRLGLVGSLVSGRTKAGVALTGLMPGPARLAATSTGDGWRLDGDAPWVSGWGMVDLLYVAARAPDDHVVSVLVEARDQEGLKAEPLRLGAADATGTVRLRFERLSVPTSSVLSVLPLEQALAQGERLRLNGSFALGVARRCTQLLGPSPLDAELAAARDKLDGAKPGHLPQARAAACALAVKASRALAVKRGSSSALAGDEAERLGREASFLLVFGSRPAIKDALWQHFAYGSPI